MGNMAIKAVLIDVGGPILDEDHEYQAWDSFLLELLSAEGIEISQEELARRVVAATRRCERNPRLAFLWELTRPDVDRFRRLKEELRAFQRRHLAEEYVPRLRHGVRGALAALAERYVLALAGNQPARIVDYLKEAGVLEFFQWKKVSEEMGVAKPDPLFFRMILDGLGVSPSEAVMVGDRLDHDILPAKLLGLCTVRVLVGPYAEQVPPSPLHCPDRTIRSLEELPRALEAMGAV